MDLILIVFFSYISGSIPFGYILTKFFGGKDVRKIGSGNIGATNVLRASNKYLAILTVILDALKGYAPVSITLYFFPEFFQLSALASFLGHLFPLWLKFKGGKGVATYLGILMALSFHLSLLFIFTWVIIFLIFKYSSLSSMFASLTVFVINFLRETIVLADESIVPASVIINSKILFIFFILIIYTHRKNILNLKNKKENKIKI
jgi:acyl phosphate:glycerol-3-phosphate acyltransferase